MTFLKLKFVFFRKVKYVLLYNSRQSLLSLKTKLKTNFVKIHNEKILIYNEYIKRKKIFFISLFINKKICSNCKKVFFLKKIYYNNKKLYLKKKLFFWGC